MSALRYTPEIQLSTVLESLAEAVFIVDSSGVLLKANPPAQRFLGRRPAEPHPSSKVVPIRDGERRTEFSAEAIERALRGERVNNEYCVLEEVGHEEGNEEGHIEALVSASPLRGPNGDILGAVVVIRDITETNELQRRLANANRDQTVGQMAAGLVHDFNNALDTLDRALVVMEMKEEASAEERRPYFAMMHRALRRAGEIIGRLRELLRHGDAQIARLEMRGLLDDTIEMLRPMLQTTYGNVRLHTQLQPSGQVRGNVADLRRVFTNLILNALQAMPNGGELEVRCERCVAGRGASASERDMVARVTISDTGHGIPLHIQQKIFQPYFTTKPSGTGLGLSEAQRIVNSYSGRIRVVSQPGRGTRFTVDLPVAGDSDRRGDGDDGAGERESRRPRTSSVAKSPPRDRDQRASIGR